MSADLVHREMVKTFRAYPTQTYPPYRKPGTSGGLSESVYEYPSSINTEPAEMKPSEWLNLEIGRYRVMAFA